MSEDISIKNMSKLEGLDHVRHRVGMYLGGADSSGITTALREILDNAVDEAISGYGKKITLIFHSDDSYEVWDEARGLPVDYNAEGISGVEYVLGNIGSGGKFNSDNYKLSGGMNGVGASATNATSTRFDVSVFKGGKLHELSFREGKPGLFAKPADPYAKFTPGHKMKVSKDPRSAAEKKAAPTGTRIRFWPDYSVFVPGSVAVFDDIKFRATSTAFLIPGLKFVLVDARESESNPVVDEMVFDGGLGDMVPTLTDRGLLSKPVHVVTDGAFTETRNVFVNKTKMDGVALMDQSSKPRMERRDVDRHVDIDLAFSYSDNDGPTFSSYVNLIKTNNGGTHESGMWRGLSRAFLSYIKETKGLLKANEEVPTMEDVRDGFVGVISVKFPEPTFTGQEKSSLNTPQITSVVSQAVYYELKTWLGTKKNARAAKLLGAKIVESSRVRLAAKKQKELAKKKSALETSTSMPPKLVECEFVGDARSELMLVEGDSALGTMRKARDARYQALFPLRGKVLNVHKAPHSSMLANAECAGLIQVMGAGSGNTFDFDERRYDKVIIETDADVDGAHIKALLITFFWKYMKDLIINGKLYSALPPLYEVKVNEGTKNEESLYAVDGEELKATVKKLKTKNYTISRNKGLGEMTDDGAFETLLNPETRRLKQITVDHIEAAESMLELSMGKPVEPRREWIASSRDKISDAEMNM